jgi:hypothetical protein
VTEESQIRDLTNQLRNGTETLWQRLRAELEARGLDPAHTSLVESFEGDYRVESGILVTPDQRVIRYEYDFYKHGDIGRGTFTAWTDITDGYEGPR